MCEFPQNNNRKRKTILIKIVFYIIKFLNVIRNKNAYWRCPYLVMYFIGFSAQPKSSTEKNKEKNATLCGGCITQTLICNIL